MDREIEEIFGDFDENGVIDLLKDLIRIPSPTGGEKEIGEFIADFARGNDYSSVKVSEAGDVVVRVDGKRKGPKLLFLTHTDHSKPIDPANAFKPEVAAGKEFGKSEKVITGKGSCAPKATLAAMLHAGKLLSGRTEDMTGSVVIAAVTKDLNANHDGPRAVDEKGWIDADMAIVGEPSNCEPVVGARGISHIAVTIKGVPTHWGRPGEGSNPIWTIEQVLPQIKLLIANLPSHSSLGAATLAPIHIDCAASPPQTPSSCRILFDRRTLPGEKTEDILGRIQEVLDRLKLDNQSIAVELASQMYPFEGSANNIISKKVMEISQAITGHRLQFGYLTFSSNGGYLTGKMGIPSVVLGPGRISDIAPKEHVEVRSLINATKIYTGTALEVLCSGS